MREPLETAAGACRNSPGHPSEHICSSAHVYPVSGPPALCRPHAVAALLGLAGSRSEPEGSLFGSGGLFSLRGEGLAAGRLSPSGLTDLKLLRARGCPRVSALAQQKQLSGLSSCLECIGVNLSHHGQSHAKKKHLPRICKMRFDPLTFTVTLINDLQNWSINRQSCKLAVRRSVGHSGPASLYTTAVWIFGRCLCATLLVRSFDEFSRLFMAMLDA